MRVRTVTEEEDFEEILISPFKFKLVISSWISVPSYVFLLLYSALMVYVVLKHFRPVLKMYLSVLLYLISQLLLLVTITASWLVEYFEPQETLSRCKIKLSIQIFALLLPGYSIVLITVVRSIFLKFPLSFSLYLKIGYQLIAFGIAAMICALLAAAPILGLCETQLHKEPILPMTKLNPTGNPTVISFCSFGKMNDPAGNASYTILLGLGFLIPCLAVVLLYIFIYKIVLAAQTSHKKLTENSSLMTGEDDGSGSVKGSSKAIKEKERRSFPWSILAILAVCITTTLPWAAMIVFKVEITQFLLEKESLSIVFDVFYSVLQILIGFSPLVYLLTTRSLRKVVAGIIKTIVRRMSSCRYQEVNT